MVMLLTREQRIQLRTVMIAAFNEGSLDLFLQDTMDIQLAVVISVNVPFESQCQSLIRWAEQEGRIDEFCGKIRSKIEARADLLQIIEELLTASHPRALGSGAGMRPYLVKNRPILNRQSLWSSLGAFASGISPSRILVVTGADASGKSYSQWVISYYCDPSRGGFALTSLDLNQGTQAEVDGAQLVNLVMDRLFPSESATRYDDLAQPMRETKYLCERLIGRLASLQQPTWLVIDGLNKVRIGKTAIDSLVRLSQAIERGECPQLWLFLIGLNPEELGPDLAPFVILDQAARPSRQDIEEYLAWFAGNVGKTFTSAALVPIVDELDPVLPPTPNHNSWREFHMALVRKCQAIQQGALP